MQNTPSLETTDDMRPANDRAMVAWCAEGFGRCSQALADVINAGGLSDEAEETLFQIGQICALSADKLEHYLDGANAQLLARYFDDGDADDMFDGDDQDEELPEAEEIDPHREASRLIFGDASYASQPLMAHQLDDVFYAGPEHGDISVNALATKIAAYRAVTTPEPEAH